MTKKTASGLTVLKLLQILWNTNIKVVFSAFYIGDLFCVTGSVTKNLWSFFVCRFPCPGCIDSYTGKTTCQLRNQKKKKKKKTDSKLTILKHLKNYQIV